MDDQLKILVVDDEEDIRFLVAMALRRDAMDVRTAGSGREALALLAEREWMPDLLIVDMLMPEMTGTDLLTALRRDRATAHLPILFMTASAWGNNGERCRRAGAVGVLAKPFDPIALPRQIRDHARCT